MKRNYGARAAGTVLAYRLLHPGRRKPHRTPTDVGIMEWERCTVRTEDGKRLRCWLLPGGVQRLAVVGHGIGLSKSASLGQAAYLNARGYTVVMFDHRNHGESSADLHALDMARRFTLDVEACVAWLRAGYGGADSKVAVFGYSFSTFPTVYAVSRGRAEIDAVVCDSGPGLSLESLFQGFMSAGQLPKIPGFRSPAGDRAVKAATAKAAVKMLGATWPPDPDAGRLAKIPIMFVVGRDDVIVEPREVQALASHYPSVEVRVVDGGHLQGFKEDLGTYLQALSGYLDRVEK